MSKDPTHGPTDPLVDRLNRLDEAAFVAEIGAVYEHSPWIAASAWRERPFPDRRALHATMQHRVRSSSRDQQLALIRAHPDLAGHLTRSGGLDGLSAVEQTRLGFDRLSDAEAERFNALNAAYRARFGMPFIIAVRNQTRATIIAAFEQRLRQAPDIEIDTALDEIGKIAGFRLDDMR